MPRDDPCGTSPSWSRTPGRGATFGWLALHTALAVLMVATWTFAAAPANEAQGFLDHCDGVFVGRLVDARSTLGPDGRLILTHYIFSAEEWLSLSAGRDRQWQGLGGEPIDVVEWGGTVGDTTLTLSHGVRYRVGGSYLVFVEKEEPDRLRTVGGPLGSLEISITDSGERIVRLFRSHPLSGLSGDARQLFQRLEELRDRLAATGRGASR